MPAARLAPVRIDTRHYAALTVVTSAALTVLLDRLFTAASRAANSAP